MKNFVTWLFAFILVGTLFVFNNKTGVQSDTFITLQTQYKNNRFIKTSTLDLGAPFFLKNPDYIVIFDQKLLNFITKDYDNARVGKDFILNKKDSNIYEFINKVNFTSSVLEGADCVFTKESSNVFILSTKNSGEFIFYKYNVITYQPEIIGQYIAKSLLTEIDFNDNMISMSFSDGTNYYYDIFNNKILEETGSDSLLTYSCSSSRYGTFSGYIVKEKQKNIIKIYNLTNQQVISKKVEIRSLNPQIFFIFDDGIIFQDGEHLVFYLIEKNELIETASAEIKGYIRQSVWENNIAFLLGQDKDDSYLILYSKIENRFYRIHWKDEIKNMNLYNNGKYLICSSDDQFLIFQVNQ